MSSKFWSGLTIFLIVSGIIAAIVWFFVGFMADSWFQNWRGFVNDIWISWLFPNGWNLLGATPFFFTLAAIVITGIIVMTSGTEEKWLLVVATVLIVASIFSIIRGSWLLAENGARYYSSTTTFVVKDTNKVPGVLSKFSTSNEAMVDMKQGNLPTGWVPRAASATGAQILLRRTGDAISNTELMSDTLTYIYGEGKSGSWTAIRNGKNQQPIYGVASWDGTNENVKTCEFTGNYELNKAFGGMWGKNLTDSIAEKFPLLTYNELDMWGYCKGDQPIIVIPATKTNGYDVRSVDQAAGVITVTGAPNGEPVIEHQVSAKPGDFPGPVYPQRLVSAQLDSLSWVAGRHLNWFENFGFEATDVTAQAGNNSNYLLKSEADGRLYWVTPLKPRSTDSQTLVAYSVTPADEMNNDRMNEQKVYVLDNDDPRIVNLDNLEAVVTDAIRTSDPGFFTSSTPGKIVEFLPVSDNQWQVFAEVNGRVKYRIDVNVGSRITTTVVQVDKEEAPAVGGSTTTPDTPVTCDNPAGLNDAQLTACLVQLANEFQKRHAETK